MKRSLSVPVMIGLMLCLIVPAQAEKKRDWKQARVLSQDITSSEGPTLYMPIDGIGLGEFPMTRRHNRIVLETSTHTLELYEAGRGLLILPVNGSVDYYQDKDWMVIIDTKNKKHKFGLMGMRAK